MGMADRMRMDRNIDTAPASQPASALDRIIGLFGSEAEAIETAEPSQDEHLLEQIGRFILSYDLGVSPITLTSAHDFVLRKDLHLIRKLREREDAGQPINRIWLETQAEPQSRRDGARKLDKVIEHLERNVNSLSKAASTARSATADYNDRLVQNERELSARGDVGVEHIVGLVAQMIDHSRTLEGKLRATEEESRAMRDDLRRARLLADEDHLTGLPNRRAFENRLKQAAASCGSDSPISVGFCDIDHFKTVNDTHGHDTGDRVLKVVAEHLAQATGNDCFVARHGGEEFALLFEGVELPVARGKLDEAREALAKRKLKDRRTGKEVGPITFSAGLALYDPGAEIGDTLKCADEALYAAKQQGRNRIISSGV